MFNASHTDTPALGDKLDRIRESFRSTCYSLELPPSPDALSRLDIEDIQNLALDLVSVLRSLPDLRKRPSVNSRRNLLSDVLRLNSAISTDDFEIDRLIPLLTTVVKEESDNRIWDEALAVLAESTPPPKPPPFLDQTPFLHTTSSFVNSSEQRKHIDAVLKEELGPTYIGVQGFYEAYFGSIEGLEPSGATLFQRCQEGNNPLFTENGWRDWPTSAKERDVLDWLSSWLKRLRDMATEEGFRLTSPRTVLAQPDRVLAGSTADRKLDIGIVCDPHATNQKPHWSHILILGELKSNPKEDCASKTWRDLGRYAREVLTTQDTRRFVLGFTLCGSIMRLWEFDRVGAIASSPFNINEDGRRFVSVMLGFLLMNDAQLGYDPTVMSNSDGKRFIDIVRNGQSERLILDSLMKRAPCVAGRATTCWKAHREGDKTNTPLVIKDSWQYPEREEEGKLLAEATEKGVVNVARYYYHETVQVGGKVDDISYNVRKGLDVTQVTNYRSICPETSVNSRGASGMARRDRSARSVARKRSSSRASTALPPNKRTCSSSPSKDDHGPALQNRVHRRVIVSDYGTAIYKARSRISMLSAVKRCIQGYESLHKNTGLLQGDISTGNLILNEEEDNPSWPAFLIDLDLAIKERRERPSGARAKTGTRAFMAIGLLLGERHSFMHDLESFFWIIFWICIHYEGPTAGRVVPKFEKWNYVDMEELAELKKGAVAHEGDFISMVNEYFTGFYKPLVAWVNRLRKVVFPNGGRWEKESTELYSRIIDVIQAACEDPAVIGE
ncbi:hypothetical protein Aspvir_010133 [Aspergillus viridinutans]|uniref:Fungal-type protein kinase domain-containing protein n=1 Tax=Aspergillus viridinutans TaxID=75553 RepID=A0A9P3C1B3_ASPVI|nr:uncharacterized protein Aspvir_010133 [Aspergillus viridinutans]GIK06015.1 hypothetical protein Aspvir_010133 [Aspergillus viridinutans]